MNPSVFEVLESYYRPKRQLRAVFLVGGLLLFGAAMASAASMWIFGIDTVPSYECSSSAKDYKECVRRYKARANEFAEARALLSLGPLAIAALAFAAWFPIRNKNAPALVRLFRERPADGVWIYPLEIRTKRRGRVLWKEHRVVVGTAQRKKHHVDVREDSLHMTMGLFSQALPHATVGYNDQLEQQFRANPESLRRPVAQAPAGSQQQQQQPMYPHQQQQHPGWAPRG